MPSLLAHRSIRAPGEVINLLRCPQDRTRLARSTSRNAVPDKNINASNPGPLETRSLPDAIGDQPDIRMTLAWSRATTATTAKSYCQTHRRFRSTRHIGQEQTVDRRSQRAAFAGLPTWGRPIHQILASSGYLSESGQDRSPWKGLAGASFIRRGAAKVREDDGVPVSNNERALPDPYGKSWKSRSLGWYPS